MHAQGIRSIFKAYLIIIMCHLCFLNKFSSFEIVYKDQSSTCMNYITKYFGGSVVLEGSGTIPPPLHPFNQIPKTNVTCHFGTSNF